MCAHVVTQSPMAELNPVSDTHALLESMLQKLQLNTQTNSDSISDMQTFGPSGDCIAEPVEDSSKTAVYQFGFSSNSKEQDKRSSVWNNWENPWTQQSPNLGSVLTPAAKPVKKITKHSGFSAKPKRPPLIWGPHKRFTSERTENVTSCVEDDQMPRLKQQFSLEGETSSNVPPSYQRQPFRNPPDLLAPTLTTSSSVLDKTEVKGQWSWASGSEKNTGVVFNEQSGKITKTSRKKLGEAKRWAQNVKERWRERHRSTQTRRRDDGQTQKQNEVHSNHSSLLTPIDVNNTPASLAETANIHQEVINTALNEDEGLSSLSYLSDSLLPFATTSDLMEEIFSGTEWAQFLSVNHTTSDQSNEPPRRINQSHEEGWNSKWTHNDTTDSHVVITQPSFLNTASDKPVYNQPDTSQMSVTSPKFTDLTTNPLQTHDPFTNLIKQHNSEQSDEQSQFSYFNPNELKASEDGDPQPMSTQMSDPSQSGTEDFIPLLDLSYIKPKDRSSITSHGSLSRKREHWTKRRDSYEHTTQDMEDKEHGSSFMTTQSSNSVSPTPSLNSVSDSISEDLALETAVKKMRMEETRRVRFAEEVIVFPSGYLPEYNEDDDDEEEEDDDDEEEEEEEVEKDNNDWPEETSPRTFLPKWIASLKGKSAKYKF